MATTLDGTFEREALSVRVVGRNVETGSVEFRVTLIPDRGLNSYTAARVYEAHEWLELSFEVDFRPDKTTRAGAVVRGFEKVDIQLTSSQSVRADVKHAMGRRKNCHLVCFETGKTSEGPCLVCPDGEYEIQICC